MYFTASEVLRMKRLSFFIIGITFFSCDHFETKKVSSEDILKQELEALNWNDVDQYPSFSECDTLTEQEALKKCFENTFVRHINTFLSDQNIVVDNDVNDTIVLDLTIDKSGTVEVLDINLKTETREEIPEIDSLLIQSVKTLPKLFPAIKRGQQVTTKFQLPIVIKIQ